MMESSVIPSFNLTVDPWIPVVNRDGNKVLISLTSVFTEGDQFVDLAVRPHERVSLMRLFICIAHAALNGPKDYDEWLDVPNKLPDAAKLYLEKWSDSFYLYHPSKPWLQVAELSKVKDETPIGYLNFALASGNNPTIYDHGSSDQRVFEPAQIALNLLTFQCFSLGGGLPIAQWKSVKTKQVGNPDAPCSPQSMLHSFLRTTNIFQSIHLNLPTFELIDRIYKSSVVTNQEDSLNPIGNGRPVWEIFPDSPDSDSEAVQNATTTYMGRLVPISRWILLKPNSSTMICSNGFKYETYRDGFAPEPSATVHIVKKGDKDEREIVNADPMKAPWRQLAALLLRRKANGLGGPLAMNNISEGIAFDFHVCAMTRKQASMVIAVESVFHISPQFQNYIVHFQEGVSDAERFAKKLGWAVESYRSELDGGWEGRLKGAGKDKGQLIQKVKSTALNFYWTTIEKNVSILFNYVEFIGTDDAIVKQRAWGKLIFKAACESYAASCGQKTPRQIRAFAHGWKKLVSYSDRTAPKVKAINKSKAVEEHALAS